MPNTETVVAQPAIPEPALLARADRHRILLYLGVLVVLLAFGSPISGLIDLPITFVLKNKLHLEAHDLALFRLVAGIPLYVSFLFGFLRDTRNPLGLGDRGFLLLFGGASALLYVGFAFVPLTEASLLAALLLVTSSFMLVSSAQNGLSSLLGQRHAISGQVSAAWNVFASLPTVVALLIGGAISNWLEGRHADEAVRYLFLLGAAASAATALYAIWRPAVVYDAVGNEDRPKSTPWSDVRRLVRHWPIYPALAIWLLWNFAPGSATPLQYYLQNTLHAEDAQWGQWNAIFAASFIPTFLLFGVLCQRLPLRRLLFWGTVVAVPQLLPLLFIHSVAGALIAAVPIGLMGGVATAAYMDLIIRSCPPGLQGTVLMLSSSLYFVAARFGDVLGTALYDHFGGFSVCVLAITVVYALILPLLTLVPASLVDSADKSAS